MITADIASDQGRVIYATPGNVDSERSEGPNRLIRDGAQVVLDGHDVLHPFLNRFQQYLSPERIRRVGKKSEYNPAVFAKLHMPDYAELARKQGQRTPLAEEDSAGLAEAMTEKLSAAPDTAAPAPVAFAKPKKPQQKRGRRFRRTGKACICRNRGEDGQARKNRTGRADGERTGKSASPQNARTCVRPLRRGARLAVGKVQEDFYGSSDGSAVFAGSDRQARIFHGGCPDSYDRSGSQRTCPVASRRVVST